MHAELYENHDIYILDKDRNNNFINECKIENHDKSQLKFFCKNHNILCCAYCINKINNFGIGEHFNCDFCHINDIKEEKRNKLKENIDALNNLSNNIEQIINKLKIIIEKINKNKEDLKLNIQKLFTKIRNTLNEKEDGLLHEVDEIYKNSYINEDLIK